MTPTLVAAARREVETREQRYPALVDQGKLERGAAVADTEAWRRIAIWLETGQVPIGRSGAIAPAQLWSPLEAAARAGLQRGDAACRKHPHDTDMRARRDAVATIQAVLARIVGAFEAPQREEEAA